MQQLIHELMLATAVQKALYTVQKALYTVVK